MKIIHSPLPNAGTVVLENFYNKGKALHRIIETTKNTTIDINYEMSEFLPTQWYIANYNVYKRGKNGIILKMLDKSVASQNKSTVKITERIFNNKYLQTTIDKSDNNITKNSKTINI